MPSTEKLIWSVLKPIMGPHDLPNKLEASCPVIRDRRHVPMTCLHVPPTPSLADALGVPVSTGRGYLVPLEKSP